jgi:hypothetical protein
MTKKTETTSPDIFSDLLITRIFVGLLVGLTVISFFIFRVPHPKPEWGEWWRVRPLIVTPLMGALCGVGYHVVTSLLYQPGWRKTLGIVLGVIGCLVGMWMGIIMGLHGTLWN